MISLRAQVYNLLSKNNPGGHDQRTHGRHKKKINDDSISESQSKVQFDNDNDYAKELGYAKWENGQVYEITDPDGYGEKILGKIGKDGRPTNAEPITVYWGNIDTPPDSIRNFAGGNTSSSSIKKNVFVSTSQKYAERYARPVGNKGKRGYMYSITLRPGEVWLPYGGASESDGLELAITIDKKRIGILREYD